MVHVRMWLRPGMSHLLVLVGCRVKEIWCWATQFEKFTYEITECMMHVLRRKLDRGWLYSHPTFRGVVRRVKLCWNQCKYNFSLPNNSSMWPSSRQYILNMCIFKMFYWLHWWWFLWKTKHTVVIIIIIVIVTTTTTTTTMMMTNTMKTFCWLFYDVLSHITKIIHELCPYL